MAQQNLTGQAWKAETFNAGKNSLAKISLASPTSNLL